MTKEQVQEIVQAAIQAERERFCRILETAEVKYQYSFDGAGPVDVETTLSNLATRVREEP